MGWFDGQAHTPINNLTRFLHYECVKSLIIIRFVSWFAFPEVTGVFRGRFTLLLILRHNFYGMSAENSPQPHLFTLFCSQRGYWCSWGGPSIPLLRLWQGFCGGNARNLHQNSISLLVFASGEVNGVFVGRSMPLLILWHGSYRHDYTINLSELRNPAKFMKRSRAWPQSPPRAKAPNPVETWGMLIVQANHSRPPSKAEETEMSTGAAGLNFLLSTFMWHQIFR